MSTFLLVPGAGGDAWYWHRVVPLLERAGHRVVPVDLPAGDPGAGWAEYAEAVVAAGRAADDVVVVASSMAAFSAPLAVGHLDVRRIVLVNAMVPAPGETAGEWWANTGQREAARAAAVAEGRDPTFEPVRDFFHDVPDEVTREATERGGPTQADLPFTQPWPLERWPDVPTAGIAGVDDRLFPADFQVEVARERLGIELSVVPGGHLVALARPGVVAAAILG